MERNLKNTPFGYKTAKELYEKLILLKFKKLKNSNDINDYYDFIFSTGALRDWLKVEQNLDSKDMSRLFYQNKYMCIFHSLYNNSKHYVLKMNEKYINYYVEVDGELAKGEIIDGKLYLTNDTILYDDNYLVDEVSGEHGELFLFCGIKDKHGNSENIFLYEICKKVICLYNNIIKNYYPD
ncbi:hypothetical protein SAMN05444280_115102 [Tangfeifania diversioriginum]|uniref:Uncharacterized protein n=1 Tax=Tangfeifania diversioriginum TaxID=1168035 RepID=A0A1M6I5Z5_9BACT|nr:hypothetical protein [Tangfeifania diversioriginum]SHJ29810.1 hypothetical protein SAMN05444280_115102 [Tangfeifania diversioriginum]